MRCIAGVTAALVLALPAAAEAPQPQKPVNLGEMSGRWYEIARLPNSNQRNCFAPTLDWSRSEGVALTIAMTCRQGSPSAKAVTRRASARVIDNGRTRVSFLGGLVSAEYRVIDHSPDWVLLGTSGGNYLWLLSRSKTLPQSVRDAAVARARQLGYNVSRFEYPPQG